MSGHRCYRNYNSLRSPARAIPRCRVRVPVSSAALNKLSVDLDLYGSQTLNKKDMRLEIQEVIFSRKINLQVESSKNHRNICNTEV